MIVKLLEDCVIKNTPMKKGQEVVVSRALAKELCQAEKAVADEDFPCPEKVKRAAAKKKRTKKKKVEEESSDIKIDNKL